MTEHDPMAYLPELPSDVDDVKAAIWAATVLLRAGAERGWRKHVVRETLISLTCGVCLDRTDAELSADIRACAARMRVARAAVR